MKTFKSALLGLLSFLAVTLAVVGRASEQESAGLAWFRALAWSGDVEGVYYDFEGKAVELRAQDHIRSRFYRASPDVPVVFYRYLPLLPNETVPRREVVGAVKLSGLASLLFVARQGDGYVFRSVAEDTTTFPLGSIRFVNATPREIAVNAGETAFRLKAGDSNVVTAVRNPEHDGVFVQITALLNKPQIVYSNIWSVSSQRRTLVFVMDTGNPNHPIANKYFHETHAQIKELAKQK